MSRAGRGWVQLYGARPDPTLPSVRINNYLNFFHLLRDSNTGKHGKGKDIDPSQLLPTPPHCSHLPHLAIWPPLPQASPLDISSLSHTQTTEGPPTQPAYEDIFVPTTTEPIQLVYTRGLHLSAHPKTGQAWAFLGEPPPPRAARLLCPAASLPSC